LPAALNFTLLTACALNGFSAYLLAHRASRHVPASILAGIFFAACPALVGHLSGRFSSYTAWPLALFAWAFIEALDGGRAAWAVAAGVLLAAVGYNDYYYFVYAGAFLVCVLVHRWLGPRLRLTPSWLAASRADHVLIGVAVVTAVTAAAIAVTGGLVLTLGSLHVSLTRGANLRALATAALIVWLWRRRRPAVTLRLDAGRLMRDVRPLGLVVLVWALLMAPLLQAAAAAMRSGEYVSQAYFWRSAPSGIDAGTFVLGNPFNGIWGSTVMRIYAALGIFGFDGPFWLSVVPIVLVATRASWRMRAPARLWLLVAAVFTVWALGPYLVVFGVNTGLPLPNTLLRFVPVAANARIPGHAAVFVCLGTAVLLALAVSATPAIRTGWRSWALVSVVALDFWAAPLPMYPLESPPIYQQLAAMPAGAVLDIPLGIRDGFGEEGRIDTSVLYYQTLHGRPIVGGYTGRIPPSVRARFHNAPVLDTLLKLSGGSTDAPLVNGTIAREFLKSTGVRYVVVETRLATPAVSSFVASMQLRQVAGDRFRRVFMID
jgi:hypothetical protein